MAALKLRAMGTTRDPDLWERLVNSHFGSDTPVLSGEESVRAARKLYRTAMGKTWTGPVKLTSGNRSTYVRGGTFYVNPNERGLGLREIIHNISHYAHRRLHPKDAPHSRRQAQLEGRLVRAALKRGFVDGALKREPPAPKPKPSLIQQRHARMVSRRDKWAKELERSKRLLAKAERELRTYERRNAEKIAAPMVASAPRKAASARKPKARPNAPRGLQATARALATQWGLTLDPGDERNEWWVYPPEGAYPEDGDGDPCDGSHFCVGWDEVLSTVKVYAADLATRRTEAA